MAALAMAFDHALAFVPSSNIGSGKIQTTQSPSKLNAAMVPTSPEAIQEMANARFAFGLCFYGAAGIGSIGRELIPVVFGRYKSTSSLESGETASKTTKATTTTRDNDEDLGIWGYPEKIYRKDVEAILNNPLTPLQIAKKFPIAEERYQYTHMKDAVPFLGYEGFVKANPKANPVALRAVFDGFSNSIGGSDAVSPVTAQRQLDLYLQPGQGRSKTVTDQLAKKLNGGKALGIAAFVFLLVLLGVGDGLAIFHLWKGWFPEWQGFSNMPDSLFDGDIGVTVLPNFFVADVPKIVN